MRIANGDAPADAQHTRFTRNNNNTQNNPPEKPEKRKAPLSGVF